MCVCVCVPMSPAGARLLFSSSLPSQATRELAIEGFKSGEFEILVATDIAGLPRVNGVSSHLPL